MLDKYKRAEEIQDDTFAQYTITQNNFMLTTQTIWLRDAEDKLKSIPALVGYSTSKSLRLEHNHFYIYDNIIYTTQDLVDALNEVYMIVDNIEIHKRNIEKLSLYLEGK